jgi:hypothetical protein
VAIDLGVVAIHAASPGADELRLPFVRAPPRLAPLVQRRELHRDPLDASGQGIEALDDRRRRHLQQREEGIEGRGREGVGGGKVVPHRRGGDVGSSGDGQVRGARETTVPHDLEGRCDDARPGFRLRALTQAQPIGAWHQKSIDCEWKPNDTTCDMGSQNGATTHEEADG